MKAEEAKKKAQTAFLDAVKAGIRQASSQGLMSCRFPCHYLTDEVERFLNDNDYKYEKHINRGGWFTETELVVDWS